MRTKNITKHLILGAMILTTGNLVGQTSVLGNAGLATNFLGWDGSGSNNFPLQVRHDGNQPIQWWTDSIQRMRLNQTLNPTINGFTNPTDGFLLLSGQPDAFTNANSRAPFTRLHLIDDVGAVAPIVYAQEIGYRPWMRNGISFSGNSDQAYIGQRYAGDDNTDFVFQWTAQRSIFSLS